MVTGGATGKEPVHLPHFQGIEANLVLIGIGLAFCIQCLSQGAKIVIAGLSISPEAQELLDTHNTTARFVRCDVAKRSGLQNLPVFSRQEFETVPDVWVANTWNLRTVVVKLLKRH